MAIATATALTAASIALTAGTTAMSFAQAGKQNKLRRQAEADATEAMAKARKRLDVNFYEQLALNKEPYELAREAMLVQGAQSVEAARESERGIAATAGRLQMAQQDAQNQIRAQMGQELNSLEKLAVAEESRLRDTQVGLDLAEVQGAQSAAAAAQKASAAAMEQGFKGVASLGQQAVAAAPLFDKTAGAKLAGDISGMAMGKDYNLSQTDLQKSIAAMGNVQGVDFSKVANMKPLQFNDFMSQVSPDILKQIKANLPNTLSSFRPSEYALPQTQVQGIDSFLLPGIGGM